MFCVNSVPSVRHTFTQGRVLGTTCPFFRTEKEIEYRSCLLGLLLSPLTNCPAVYGESAVQAIEERLQPHIYTHLHTPTL